MGACFFLGISSFSGLNELRHRGISGGFIILVARDSARLCLTNKKEKRVDHRQLLADGGGIVDVADEGERGSEVSS